MLNFVVVIVHTNLLLDAVETCFELVGIVDANATLLADGPNPDFVDVIGVTDVVKGDATDGEFCDAGDDDAAAIASAAAFLACNIS